MKRITLLVAVVLGLLGARLFGADDLARAFARPPAQARAWVYWYFMDGLMTREGLTADLEAMKRAGIGGAIFLEVNIGLPRGPVEFMSPQWQALFTHAVREADRLGIEIALGTGPGWCGSGGPWIQPEQSMQHLVASQTGVVGPQKFSGRLPQPLPRRPYFGEGSMTPEVTAQWKSFYRDVAVLAFPTPEGTNDLADVDEKALYYREPYSSKPGVKPFLPAPAEFPVLAASHCIPTGRVIDLTAQLAAEGQLTWNVPPGRWTLMRLGRTITGQTTRPAPQPGLGLESDKFNPAALDAHFAAFTGKLLAQIGPRTNPAAGLTTLHFDSWEMGAQNWSAHFRAEFKKRRGYDLLPYLPAFGGLVVGTLEVTERLLWDVRQTASELVVESHARHWRDLAHRNGLQLSIEPYDLNPSADLALGAEADVPMCEFWADGDGFDTAFSCLEATSIAHTHGRAVIGAEAFTAGGKTAWVRHPGLMKNQADWAFAVGINRLAFHRYQHQPWTNRVPGLTMGGYGTQYERTQTWWEMSGAWHDYLSRCQYLLRQGLPVADILYLTPEGAPQVFRAPPSALAGARNMPDRKGYNFDGIDPQSLLDRVCVRQGRLELPDGMSYRVLVLPERETMTPVLLRKLKALVTSGATLVGPPPRKSPSLVGYPRCDAEVGKLATELWGDCDGSTIKEHAVGRGRVRWDRGASAKAGPGNANPLAAAQWIWFPEGNPAASAPPGRRSFRRALTLPSDTAVASATLSLTADNSFVLFVNGRQVGTGDDFHETASFDVQPLLRAGTNILAIVAENGDEAPNPAGLIGALVVKFQDGRGLEIPTDRQWQSASSVASDWTTNVASGAGWSAALELGPFGMAPWNRKRQPAVEASQYGEFAVVSGVLQAAGVPLDFEANAPVRYLHRHLPDREVYFVSNPSSAVQELNCTFRVAGKQPELWDPLTGRTRSLSEFTRMADGRTGVPLRMEPAQSYFIVFRAPVSELSPGGVGKNFPELRPVAEVAGSWELGFQAGRGAPERIALEKLSSWTEHPEAGIKYFSGEAVYRKTIHLAPELFRAGRPLYLDLGRVEIMAQVTLNGHKFDTLWCAPYRLDIAAAAQPGENVLEIRVVNLWPNRMIGDEQLPADSSRKGAGHRGNVDAWPQWLLEGHPSPTGRITFASNNPFTKNSPLLPSGLLGPVRLLLEGD